uniref:Immunoglobulin domain-containing protein n=1 Tax=Sander lucioperca TaxID=283035 RepID=A0A8C9YYH4_SANLU
LLAGVIAVLVYKGNKGKVIKVKEGSDVRLSFSRWPKKDITSTEFIWKKVSQTTDDDQMVFLYDNGDLYSDERPGQSEQFKGRVSHFPDKLKQGNASIIIRNTTRADSGEYRCIYLDLQNAQTFHIKLDVVGEYFDEPVKDVLSFKDWSLLVVGECFHSTVIKKISLNVIIL